MRTRPRHGTKRRWRDLAEADNQAVGLGRAWYEVAQDRKEWEEICRQCCANDSNKDGGHSAANSSNTNTDSSYPFSCGRSFRAKETSPDTADSSMTHNIRATERRPPLLTVYAEERSEDKETAQDTPPTAPLVPHDC